MDGYSYQIWWTHIPTVMSQSSLNQLILWTPKLGRPKLGPGEESIKLIILGGDRFIKTQM